MFKGGDHLTKRQYVHATANSTLTDIFTTTTSIATTYKVRALIWKFQEVYEDTYYQRGIPAMSLHWLIVLSWNFQDWIGGMFYWTKCNMLMLLMLVVLLIFNTLARNINTTYVITITTVPKGMKVKISRNFETWRRTYSQHIICIQVVKRV